MLLALLSVTAGLLSGRLWSLTLAASIIPAAAVLWFVPSDDYHGDSVSGPLDAALFGGLFVLPLAVAIAVGVGLRRLVGRRRSRARSGPHGGSVVQETAADGQSEALPLH